MVTGIEMREGKVSSSESKEAESDGTMLLDRATRGLSTIPVGTIDASGKFERGTDVLPTVNAPVFAVSPALIDQVYASYADGDFAIGKLSILPGNWRRLTSMRSSPGTPPFSARRRREIVDGSIAHPENVRVSTGDHRTLDLHGEYTKTFGASADVIAASDLELPYWLMNSEELLGLMVDRTESAAPNQIAKFKELLQGAKEEHPENQA